MLCCLVLRCRYGRISYLVFAGPWGCSMIMRYRCIGSRFCRRRIIWSWQCRNSLLYSCSFILRSLLVIVVICTEERHAALDALPVRHKWERALAPWLAFRLSAKQRAPSSGTVIGPYTSAGGATIVTGHKLAPPSDPSPPHKRPEECTTNKLR